MKSKVYKVRVRIKVKGIMTIYLKCSKYNPEKHSLIVIVEKRTTPFFI